MKKICFRSSLMDVDTSLKDPKVSVIHDFSFIEEPRGLATPQIDISGLLPPPKMSLSDTPVAEQQEIPPPPQTDSFSMPVLDLDQAGVRARRKRPVLLDEQTMLTGVGFRF